MSPIDRRQFLTLGSAATAVALGGCLGGDGGESEPTYATWAPAGDGSLWTAYLDVAVARESEEAEQLLPVILPSDDGGEDVEAVPSVSGQNSIDDPLLVWPLEVGGQLIGAGALGLAVAGLGAHLDPETSPRGFDELLFVSNVGIGTGDLDADRLDETLRDGDPEVPLDVVFEPTGEYGEFALYEPAGDDADGIIAVGESAVLIADTVAEIRAVVDVWRGDGDRAVDAVEPYEWLVEAVGSGHVTAGWVGPVDLEEFYFDDPGDRPVADRLARRDDVMASVTFSPDDGTVTADLALGVADGDGSARRRLASEFGSASEDVTVSGDGDRASVTATYAPDVLDVEFRDRGQGDDGPDVPSGDPPPEVREAVPGDALEFSYEPDRTRVRVEIVEPIDAEHLRIVATEGSGEFSTSTPNGFQYMNVQVDPDGDEVVVVATVDGAEGTVARWEVP